MKGEIKLKILLKLFKMSYGYCFHIICALALIFAFMLFIMTTIMKETIGSKMGEKEDVSGPLF